MRWTVAFALMTLPAAAQTVVDQSVNVVRPESLRAMFEAIGDKTTDPMSSQIRRLRLSEKEGRTDVVCGEINAKNRFGGYVGFTPFFFDTTKKTINIYEKLPPSHPVYKLGRLPFEFVGCPLP